MGYTRNDIIRKCKKEILNVSNFYKADFINYRGKTLDTGEFYTEIIAEFVCRYLDEFEKISKITRESSYKTSRHDGNYSATSNRLEEITAMQMFNVS